MEENKWEIRDYQEGDENRILSVFNFIFNKDRKIQSWEWKFKKNPYHSPISSIAVSLNNEIVGQYTAIPIKLNFMGNDILACHSVDTMVHPDYRRQSMFEKTASHFYKKCEKEGFCAIFGFPNRNSYPGFMRKLNWKRILLLKHYCKRISLLTIITRIFHSKVLSRCIEWPFRIANLSFYNFKAFIFKRLKLKEDYQFNVSSTVPDNFEMLWAKIKSYEVLSIWKDTEYLNWRYDSNPQNEFEYLFLEHNGDIHALFIALIKDSKVTICDIFVINSDIYLGQYLLIKAMARYIKKGKSFLEFFGSDIGFYNLMFKGFSTCIAFNLVFCGRVFSGKKLQEDFYRADNWNITTGDLDSI